jgi:hypothetical protein
MGYCTLKVTFLRKSNKLYLEGIAYTIDPAYEAEVRDYLGTKF